MTKFVSLQERVWEYVVIPYVIDANFTGADKGLFKQVGSVFFLCFLIDFSLIIAKRTDSVLNLCPVSLTINLIH